MNTLLGIYLAGSWTFVVTVIFYATQRRRLPGTVGAILITTVFWPLMLPMFVVQLRKALR